jgi:D-alanyl-D-alanine carboxypeptidase
MRGLKTGITDLAGQCFVGYFVYPSGNELITVIINSQDRFGETVLIEKYAREKLK